MDVSSIDETELDSTRGEDSEWVTLREENLLYNDSLINTKFNDLDEDKEETNEEDEDDTSHTPSKDEKALDAAHKLIGLVEVEEINFKKNAIQQWTKELLEASLSLRDSSSSFLSLLRKRLEVQHRLHKAYLRERERHHRSKASPQATGSDLLTDGEEESEKGVPVVVRLGLLTLFPLIESLSAIKDVNYSKLCKQVLDILQQVMSTLPPLALHNEPDDCLNAFQDFIYSLVRNNDFNIDTEEKSQAILALVGVAISRGNAKDLLLVVDVLFRIYKKMGTSSCRLKIGSYLKQLVNYRKEQDLCALYERGFLGSWTLPHSIESSATPAKLDALASDGTYLYIHSYRKGLRKLGTGYGGTIKGHLYHHSNYRQNDKQKTFVCIGKKLYYLLPHVSDAPEGKEEEVKLQLAVIDTFSLAEEKVVTLKEKGPKGYLMSDGVSLFLLSRQLKHAEKEENDKYLIETFHPLTLQLLKTVELGHAAKGTTSFVCLISADLPIPGPMWEKVVAYTTGSQLGVYLPDNTSFSRSRFFSLTDGKYLGEVPTRNEPLSSCVAFDCQRNVFWFLADNKVEIWKNLSPAPKTGESEETSSSSIQPPDASTIGELVEPLEGIFLIILSMDRLGRSHPIYDEATVPEMYESVQAEDFLYSVESHPKFFQLLHSIVFHILSSSLPPPSQAALLLPALKLLKVNLLELADSPLSLRELEGNSVLKDIREMLTQFIENPPLQNVGPLLAPLQEAASSAMTVGFLLLNGSTLEQRQFLKHLLEGAATLSPGKQKFLQILLAQFADWDDISEVFLEEEKTTKKKEDSMEVETDKHQLSLKLIDSLVTFAFQESLHFLSNFSSFDSSPLVSPTLRLLLVLQRDIVSNPVYAPYLFPFVQSILTRCTELVEIVLKDYKEQASQGALDKVLQSTMLGCLPQALLNSLGRKRYLTNLNFSKQILPGIMNLLKVVDQLNQMIPSIPSSDQKYLRSSLHNTKAERVTVESKHPYGHGKNLFRQTVTLSGAESLSLHFDPRSRTYSASSDVLQLFKSPSMSDPVISPKDGKALIFSGNNFPKQTLWIPGDTVTLVFSAGTRPEKNEGLRASEGHKNRWGFKCRVSGTLPKDSSQLLIDHFLLDLECSLALVGSKFSATLIEGVPMGAWEKQSQPWLAATLLNGGLEEEGNAAEAAFLEDYIHKRGDAAVLCSWMERNAGRRVLSALSKAPLELTERYVVASMLKQLCMVEEAVEFSQLLKNDSGSKVGDSITKSKFASLAQESGKITMSLQQKGQAENEWRISVEERPTFEGFYSVWKDEKKEKVMDMCLMKGVEFDSQDEKATMKALFLKLQEDIASGEGLVNSGNKSEPYEIVSKYVRERAKLLLRMRPPRRVVAPPSSHTPNPFERNRDTPLTSSVPSVPDAPTDSPSMLRTSSYFPKTENTISKEEKLQREEMKSKAFRRRLKELRKWLQAYKSWKMWQEGTLGSLGIHAPTPPRSPLHAVSTFVQSSLGVEELESLLKIHKERAKERVDGLQYYRLLLSLPSFNSVRHQVLSQLGHPLVSGGHYLENIPTCGPDLSQQVTNAFYPVFEEMIKILREKNTDHGSKLLALILCGIAYREHDVDLLRSAQIFPLLQQIITDCNQKILARLSKPLPPSQNEDTMQMDKPEEGRDKEKEEKEEFELIKKLRSSSWIAFRLLATRCVAWESDVEEVVLQSESLKELQDQIFELMCSELKVMSQKMTVDTEEGGDQCFELLSLLCLLGGSGKGFKSLSREENLMNLISILKTPETEPRAKRLALRLCRRLLAAQSKETMPRLIDFFLGEIGLRLFPSPKKDSVKDDPSEKSEDFLMEDDEEGEEECEEEPEEEEYAIFLNSWTQNFQRLIEVCHNAMGAEFFGTGGLDRHTIEAKVQQVLQEINEEGKSLLKVTTLANCNALAQGIASLGGTVTISPVPASHSSEKVQTQPTRNRKKIFRKMTPTLWTNGEVAQGLASEYIYILRHLLSPSQESSLWSDCTRDTLQKVLLTFPKILSSSSVEDFRTPLAVLSVLGGFSETVRVGGTVLFSEVGNVQKRATVIDMEACGDHAQIILQEDSSKTLRKVPSKSLKAMEELELDPSLFPLSVELLKCLLAPFSEKETSAPPSWILTDLKSRSLKVLAHLLGSSTTSQTFLSHLSEEFLPLLVQLAHSSKASSRQSFLEEETLSVLRKYWDKSTRPSLDAADTKVKTMVDILPYFPHAHMAESLPTTFSTQKLQGFIFRGDERRKLEFVGFEPALLGRRSYIGRMMPHATEIVLLANCSVPSHLPEYYYEVTIDQADSSSMLVSVGFVPEGAKNWGNGSFKYQANAKKTTFVGGSRKQTDYGTSFRAKSVIGCGWNREEKIIYFTKDGIDQGVAFTNVNFSKMVPAIGLSRGVHMTVNFGQEEFKFKLVVEGESPEEREKRKKEEEEKRKREQKEEEERLRKEKEDERAAHILEAQPLVNMGFSLAQVLVALRETGHSGPEAASNWLVENSNYNFDEEAIEDEAKEEDKESDKGEEKTEEKSEETAAEKAEENKPVQEMDIDPEMSREKREKEYNTKASQHFALPCIFAYKDEASGKDQSGNRLAAEWEDSVIPFIRSFMEKDGFSPFEVEEYLQQIRTQLGTNNDSQAKAIVMQIVGDAGIHVPFPSSTSPASRGEKPPLKMEELQLNDLVTVSKTIPPEVKDWVPPMDKTKGVTGVVKALDHMHSLVLVQFYSHQLGTIQEWWYSLKVLEKSDAKYKAPVYSQPIDSLLQQLESSEEELIGIHARRSVLNLLSHGNSSLSLLGPLGVKNTLSLLSREEISSKFLVLPNIPSTPSPLLRVFRQRLLELLESGNVENLSEILTEETLDCWERCSQLHVKSCQTLTSPKPPPTSPQHIKIDGARSLLVTFDKSNTFLPSNSQASIAFYVDEDCTNLIVDFPEKSAFHPFGVPSNEIWMKILCSSPTHRGNLKYKFAVTPLHPSLGMAFWLTELVLQVEIFKSIPTFPKVCGSLFHAIMDYIYCLTVPSLLKESLFYLVAQLLHISKKFPPAHRLPLERLLKLQEELSNLYEAEKSREKLFSSYFQSLAELFVVAKGVELIYGESVLFPAAEEESTPEGEENLKIAMELSSSIRAVEEKLKAEEQKKVTKSDPPVTPGGEDIHFSPEHVIEDEEDPELAQALAMSLAESGHQSEGNAEEKKEGGEKEEGEKGEEEEEGEEGEEGGDLFGEAMEDIDEETKAAIAMSMEESKSTGEEPKEEKEKEGKEEKEKESQEEKKTEPKEEEGWKEMEENFFGEFSPFPFSFPAAKTKKKGKKVPKNPKASTSVPNPLPWLDALFHVKQLLDVIDSPCLETDSTFRELVKRSWETTKKDSIKERVVVIDNLPLLEIDRAEEMAAALKRNIADFALVRTVHVAVDETSKRLKGFAFVELRSAQKVEQVIKKMHRHKLKAPSLVGEDFPTGPNLRSSLREGNLPRGILTVAKFKELESSQDPRVGDFLLGKLVRGKTLTKEMSDCLTEVFNAFGGAKEGVLRARQLNELQVVSCGKPLDPEQLEYALSTYQCKGEGAEKGLTLEGFLDLYLRQSSEAPWETWEELHSLGYDLHLEKSSFVRLEEAIESAKKWTSEMDSQLSEHVRTVTIENEISSPQFLSLDQLEGITSPSLVSLYPSLSKVSLPALRLRFQMLKDFNGDVAASLPFIHFDRWHSSSLASSLARARGLIFHSTKFEFIYRILDETAVSVPQPTVTIDRLKMASRKEKATETSMNHTMFGVAFQQLKNVSPVGLRQRKPGGTEPHFSIKIVFKGENVQGEGGPYRQFFTDVSKELQGVLPLFIPCPNAQQGLGENRDKWIISPSADSPTLIQMFEFLGRLIGLTIRTGVLLMLDLPPFFWKPLVGLATAPSDLKLIDESVYGTLKYISECTQEELERDIDETFTTFLSDKTKVPLVKGGENIKVTIANRDEYVKLVEKVRLNESHQQLEAIRRGLADVIPPQLLSLCTWKDLEWKVCGESRVDISLLRRHTICSGVPSDSPHISYFWQTLQEFSQQDRKGFLRFAWAQERLPVNDEEFERTKTRMMIKPFAGLSDPNAAFPKADTCFFNIMLPEYTSQRITRERLLFAIYTDSHSMNADEPQEDELATVNGRGRGPPGMFDYSSESDSEE